MSTHTAERTTTLPGGPADAWHAVMAPDIAPLIDPGVRTWQPDSEPPGVGTRWRVDVTAPPPASRLIALLLRRAMAAQASALTAYLASRS